MPEQLRRYCLKKVGVIWLTVPWVSAIIDIGTLLFSVPNAPISVDFRENNPIISTYGGSCAEGGIWTHDQGLMSPLLHH